MNQKIIMKADKISTMNMRGLNKEAKPSTSSVAIQKI